nr:hypothetical protein CFP56_07464 [Quercus suber]
MLRLRLQIQRNELPTINILWPVQPTQTKYTIVQLLEQVNRIFPLESDTWGLEHYHVSIGDYECLHYHEIGTVCKDEDEVVIRPLQYAEVRARTLLGRDQITPDGRHLHDGVPWGKPLLRAAVRPSVRIPPRKRQRVEDVLEGPELSDEEFLAIMAREDAEARGFVMEDDQVSSDESSSEDESTEPSSESDSEESSDVSSDSTGDGSERSFDGFKPDEPEPRPMKAVSQASDTIKATLKDRAPGIPFQGTSATHNRNARRRHQRLLKHLVRIGKLPNHATFRDLYSLLDSGEYDSGIAHNVRAAIHDAEGATEVIEHDGMGQDAVGYPELTDETSIQREDSEATELQAKRRELIDAITSGGVDVTESNARKPSKRKVSEVLDDDDDPPDELPVKPSSERHAKGISSGYQARMIFGALGVRAPKTDADKDGLQKKLAVRAGRNMSGVLSKVLEKETGDAMQATSEQMEEEDEDPHAWREHIELSAVECVGEPLTYPAPPFPFRKHWHNKKKDRDGKVYMEKRRQPKKRRDDAATEAYFTEQYDKYNTEGGGDALNYDDDVEVEGEEGYWEDSAFLEDTYTVDTAHDPASQQLLDETETAKSEMDDDFPLLPGDLASLSALSENTAQIGDFVVFDELTCSAATNWQPKTLTLTGKLDSKSDDGWTMLLARRDVRSKTYDDNGQRVYEKFEMAGLSDNEDEEDDEFDRWRTMQWSQMGTPKLLLRGSENAANAASGQEEAQ